MKCVDRYPIIVTDQKSACETFWTKVCRLTVGFSSSWFVYLTAADGSASIAFMTPDHPSAPPGPEKFGGQGMCLELQVEDAGAALAELTARGLNVEYPLTDEPFGQRRFGFRDPSGLWVDVVQQTQPREGWWDRYMVAGGAADAAAGQRESESGKGGIRTPDTRLTHV